MRTVHIETQLPTDAEQVWAAMQHPTSFTYVCRGVLGIPTLVGRTAAMRESESGTGWLLLFHLIPLSRHTIHLVEIDPTTKTLRTHEHGGLLRSWNHALHVEPISTQACRYSDTVDIDAGTLTPVVARLAILLYRYRQRRWHKLVHKHLRPEGPAYAR